jgi:hypothetical protein
VAFPDCPESPQLLSMQFPSFQLFPKPFKQFLKHPVLPEISKLAFVLLIERG